MCFNSVCGGSFGALQEPSHNPVHSGIVFKVCAVLGSALDEKSQTAQSQKFNAVL